MHLFAAKPGGFVDAEGIVDLAQTPGQVLVLAASDSVLAALAEALHRMPDDWPEVRLANWLNLIKPAAFDLYRDQVLDAAQVVVASLLGGSQYWQYGHEQLLDWAAANSTRTLILVPGCDANDEPLLAGSTVPSEVAHQVWRYLRLGGPDNAEQCLRFVDTQWRDASLNWQPPVALPDVVTITYGGRQHTLEHWRETFPEQRPVALFVMYRSHLQGANTRVLDAMLSALPEAGLTPLAVAVTSLKDEAARAALNVLMAQVKVAVVINTTSFAINRVPAHELGHQGAEVAAQFAGQPVVLQAILASNDEADWLTQPAGLRSRDIAMQVVLPEMDGRIITRAVGFKSAADFSTRGQISVIRHQPVLDRVAWVAQLAARFAQLRTQPNADKRVALILANYPSSEGRIGNGVGLDTPASTAQLLKTLAQAGYWVEPCPQDGAELIEWLQGGVSNDPITRDLKPCWQSLSFEQYRTWFAQMPMANQQAITQRWGEPEADPACRQGRLMVSGVRLGHVFVGVQPARGFHVDLVSTYHDAELVPPHSYLAFYFWLRHVYGVDAIVHVGKHGNLEWLPGKSTALANTCWPDVILGPTPHFYPFIVNDPGEGAQAKRRTHAVIIDHLMPPLTRAETYGALTELENLVDEYYEAAELDPRRELWLRQAILKQMRAQGLDQELPGLAALQVLDDATVLTQLDAYLCDIKEAQIRQGLHILGQLPGPEKLTDTVLALLRVPRGQAPEQQGILHALGADLGLLDVDAKPFDPLRASATPWQGTRPPALVDVSNQPWRTAADTRERLELLAHRLVSEQIVQPRETPGYGPHTTQLCAFARDQLLPALHQSAVQEHQALLDGLCGRFVLPGPSGAPSRGRLDVLPTGRNFYSLDSRAVPSPAAWVLGQKSAQALVERHLQEHGEFPEHLGLSIWGTATMRTGGDDIAQAMALMGVRPIWSPGSNRVVDFEVLSTMQMTHPRVDVTLRVSGFFRDAFPAVIRLLDQAVQAIANYEEPGTGNTIRRHVLARQAELEAAGAAPEQAQREATYRVFGGRADAYGTGIGALIDQGNWQQRSDLGEAWLTTGSYAYGQAGATLAADAFAHQVKQLDAVLHNQDNREHDILDSDAYYQFQGGMAAAVELLKGSAPTMYHADHANPEAPRIRTLKEELNRVIRSRVLNPKWLHAMQEHGYKGAFEMAATVDLMFGYDATTGLIDGHQYQQITDALALDPVNQAFMRSANPKALETMAERLLEAVQRGLWQAPSTHVAALQDLLLSLDQQAEGQTLQSTAP